MTSNLPPSRNEEADVDSRLEALLALPLDERIGAVVEDVCRRVPQFSDIDAHDLADALEVPDHRNPGSEWSFISYARIVSAEEHAQESCSPASDVVYWIEGMVSTERFEEIVKHACSLGDVADPSFAFLTEQERSDLEQKLAKRALEANQSNGMSCIARYSIKSGVEAMLEFEGDIEDDGLCLTLRTPYDKYANRFTDLSNCVTSHW